MLLDFIRRPSHCKKEVWRLLPPITIAKTMLAVIGFQFTPAFAAPDLSEYEVVFADEFSGATLDPQRWATAPLWGPYVETNMEEQYYVDTLGINAGHDFDPFSLSGNSLIISAEPVSSVGAPPAQPAQSDTVWGAYPEYNFNADYLPSQRNYLSGLISTVNSYNFTHGYVEARAKVPSGRGLWPAFWLLTSKYVEDVPEIDIMEYIGQYENEVNHTLHYFDIDNGWSLVSSPTYKTTGPDYSSDFHTFGLMWSPKEIVWYVDDVEVKRVTDQDFLIAKQSMYIIANLAVGGSWPGSPNDSTPFPANFELDYIRAYQKKPPAVITPETLETDYQLMFSDEFNGNNLDPNKWLTHYLWGPYYQINLEEQVYIDSLGRHENFPINPYAVADGTLTITADEITAADLPEQPDVNDAEWSLYPEQQFNPNYANNWTPGYSSGMITSYDSFKFVNGYVEMRAKVPQGDGLWPAFWLLNGYYIGNLPEIDIMEMQGEQPQSVHQTYHYQDSSGNLVSSPAITTKSSGDYSDGEFHTFGVQWHPGSIKWYIDGELTRTLNDPSVSTQLMYIIVNLAVGGNFVGTVDTTFPKTLEVDYIRAYQLKPNSDNSSMSEYSVQIGDLGDGIAVDDNAVGAGYLMYSEESSSDRFASPALFAANASNVVAVRYVNGGWQYNNNSVWTSFTPRSTDVLLASVDFQAGSIIDLKGLNSTIGSIPYGYAAGDLSFLGNRWAGKLNSGEFQINGTGFDRNLVVNSEPPTLAGSTNNGIAVQDNANGNGYIMYSETDLASRFSNNPPFIGSASNLVAVKYSDGSWYYDDNSAWRLFLIEPTDVLVASVNFSTHSIQSLEGQSFVVDGVQAGYIEGDLVFTADQWSGQSNYGEYGVSGTGFDPNPGSSNPNYRGAGALGKGIAVTENAAGTGFLMYSAENVFTRFSVSTPFSGNARHFIAIRFNSTGWEYNTNSSWVSFSPRDNDVLVAAVDYSFDTVSSLQGKQSIYKGISLGFSAGDLTFSANQWAGSSNQGEFEVAGSWFETNVQSVETISIGDTGKGLAVRDNANGIGYLLYSKLPIADRFLSVGLFPGIATNLIAVRFTDGQWQFNNNSNWVPFQPEVGDRLLAELNFSVDTVNLMEGMLGLINSIESGFISSDISVSANRWGNYQNSGEFFIQGTYFSDN